MLLLVTESLFYSFLLLLCFSLLFYKKRLWILLLGIYYGSWISLLEVLFLHISCLFQVRFVQHQWFFWESGSWAGNILKILLTNLPCEECALRCLCVYCLILLTSNLYFVINKCKNLMQDQHNGRLFVRDCGNTLWIISGQTVMKMWRCLLSVYGAWVCLGN